MTTSSSSGDCATTASTASASTGQRSSVWAHTMTLAGGTGTPRTRALQAISTCLEHSRERELFGGLGRFPAGWAVSVSGGLPFNRSSLRTGRRTHSMPSAAGWPDHTRNGRPPVGTSALDHLPALRMSVQKTRRPRPSFPKGSCLTPAKNEAANLPHVLPALPDIVSEVLLVDGRSTDDTIAVARRLRPDV